MKAPNQRQLEVICQTEENILLFASAGTGKTFTVAQRVANLLTRKKAAAEEVLCLTFTIKACNEMKEDILQIVGKEGEKVSINTIHGFCFKLIGEETKRRGGNYGQIGVCDEVDQEETLKRILTERCSYWYLEKNLGEYNLATPDLRACPAYRRGEDIVWRVENKLFNSLGKVFDWEEGLAPYETVCPACGKRTGAGICPHCGKEITLHLRERQFEICRRRSALRNLVSEVKHCRMEGGFYSGDEIADNARAYAYLKENKREKYEGLTASYARYLGYVPDESFCTVMDEHIGRLVAEYDRHLSLSNLLDFDDLIMQAKRLLEDEEGREYWSNKFSYIILDEMQDTSRLEYSLLEIIFGKNNVMLCGDFFQTIYAWRGSCPQEILAEYVREYAPKDYMLSVNYRATKTLAAASFGYLKNTYPQLVGKYCPNDLEIQSPREGDKIFCYAFYDHEEEARQIYSYLLRAKKQGEDNVCVLARSNKYIAKLSAYFEGVAAEKEEEEKLRFFTVEENFQFFKKPLVKDVLALLKLLLNPFDRVSMERLTEKYVRQVGVKTMETLRAQSGVGVSISAFLEEETYTHGDCYHGLIKGYCAGGIVVYDTETTGLDLQKDQPVQIAAIKLGERGEIVDTLDILIEPTVPIEKGAMDTHGFTLEYIQAHGGVTLKEGLLAFCKFAKGCTLVGHNNFGYDKPLIERLLREEGLPPMDSAGEYDTLPIAKQFYPSLDNYKLETLCARFGVRNEQAHNALGDITATAQCLCRMLEEQILPTALERREILSKHAPKFEKFYEFYKELTARLDAGEKLVEYAAERLMLRKRYPTYADGNSLRDLIADLDVPTADRKAFLREYLKDAALSGSQMDLLIQKSNKIPVITVHQAKGCEFNTVIVAGADDSNFPSFAAKQSGYEEEERKIFYVAITRARERLILTRALHNGNHRMDETPYFWKIPEEYVRVNRAWKNGNE